MHDHDRTASEQSQDEARARKVVQYWPIVAWLLGYLLASIFAFTALQAHVGNLEVSLRLHKEQQEIDRRELNEALREIRNDDKAVLAREGKQ